MKHFMRLLGGVALLGLMGAGCNFTSLGETQQDTSDDAITEVQEENAKLKKDLASLEKKLDKLEEKAEEMKDEKSEDEEEKTEEAKDDSETSEESEEEKKNLNERGAELVGALVSGDSLSDNRINIYIGSEGLGSGSEDPVFKIGCGDYLYGLTIQLDSDKTQSDLATAIVQLLTYKPSESEGENWVRGKGLTLENVTYEDGVRIIELAGEPTIAGTCEVPRIKSQLEETIAIYSDNFEIRLNGSAKEWTCLFDQSDNESGNCS